jgi:hypothetical protein
MSIGGTISRTRTISPTEQRIREFLNAKERMGLSTSATLVQIDRWTTSLQNGGSEAGRIAARAERRAGSDLIERISECLIDGASGVERKLLSKSLQEALLYCSGFETEIDYSEFKSRFMRYLNSRGASAFIRRFLSFYFFNFVWFHTGESFRALAWTSDSFAKDISNVERICEKVVASAWKSFRRTQRDLDSSAALELIRGIEEHFRGVEISEPRRIN